jgi:hypothetical protein
MTTTVVIAILAFCAGLWGKKILEERAARRKAEHEEQQRIRQEEDESTRYHLIQWAFGDSNVKGAPQIRPPKDREEVIATLRNRDAAIKLLEALLDYPEYAEQEYRRFISWFDLTGGERELRGALPMYLLGIWASPDHPHRQASRLKLLVENFKLTESQANEVMDRYHELLP